MILVNKQCLNYVFYSLLLLQTYRVCLKGHQNKPHTLKFYRAGTAPPPILKFLDPPMKTACKTSSETNIHVKYPHEHIQCEVYVMFFIPLYRDRQVLYLMRNDVHAQEINTPSY